MKKTTLNKFFSVKNELIINFILKNKIDFEENNNSNPQFEDIIKYILLKKLGSVTINCCLEFWSREILIAIQKYVNETEKLISYDNIQITDENEITQNFLKVDLKNFYKNKEVNNNIIYENFLNIMEYGTSDFLRLAPEWHLLSTPLLNYDKLLSELVEKYEIDRKINNIKDVLKSIETIETEILTSLFDARKKGLFSVQEHYTFSQTHPDAEINKNTEP